MFKPRKKVTVTPPTNPPKPTKPGADFKVGYKADDNGTVKITVFRANSDAKEILVAEITRNRKGSLNPNLSFAQALSKFIMEAEEIAAIMNGKRLPIPEEAEAEVKSSESNPCAECGKPANGDDYLCDNCRE